MLTFFDGWRRKAGAITLVATLSIACFWIRGFAVADSVYFGLLQKPHLVGSASGSFLWFAWDSDPQFFLTKSETIRDERSLQEFLRGFHSLFRNADYRIVPAWKVILPLTLLSAYLLLSKPRSKPNRVVAHA